MIGGVFKFYSSITGLPLDEILEFFKPLNYVVDWIAFCDDALNGGWTYKGLVDRIECALTDVYTIQYRDEVMKRVLLYLDNK